MTKYLSQFPALFGRNPVLSVFVFVVLLTFSISCSIQDLVIQELSNSLTGTGPNANSGGGGITEVFLGDNDPEFIADALPFAIKIYEALLALNPDHDGLALTTGSLYVMYANAFIQLPASMYPLEDFDRQQSDYLRARNLYLRGRDILGTALERKYPGMTEVILSGDGIDELLAELKVEDVNFLYWYLTGWVGPITINSLDVDILFHLNTLALVLARAYELNPTFNNGAFEELYISVYSALPEALGGGLDKAMDSFDRAITLQNGQNAGPYVALAQSVARPMQDREWYIELLETALAIDPDANPNTRLLNTIMQNRAKWLLENIDNFFI